MRKRLLQLSFIIALLLPTGYAYAQDDEDIVNLLTREVEVENPVYMPTIGAGVGYFSFFGDFTEANRNFLIGTPGFRVNAATFLGRKHYLRGNIYFMMGTLQGSAANTGATDWLGNYNFESSIYSFGFNVHYSFKPLIQGKYFEPFISIGAETLQFDSRSDELHISSKTRYEYWNDGTIRGGDSKQIIGRDYDYETNLRKENKHGLVNNQFSAAIPVEVGMDFNVSERLTLRLATSFHYTFTDLLDDLTWKSTNPEYKGKEGNDMFTYSYCSLHLDLFSSDKTMIVEDLYANLEDFDMTMYEDEDNDGVFDGWDACPGTPMGVAVNDSTGCPFDTDGDGVPDYLDKEDSRRGVVVDENGIEVNELTVVSLLEMGTLKRSDVETYLLRQRQYQRQRSSAPIPDKFKKVDTDSDGSISFDELLQAINGFFDDDGGGYTPAELQELNDLFFQQ